MLSTDQITSDRKIPSASEREKYHGVPGQRRQGCGWTTSLEYARDQGTKVAFELVILGHHLVLVDAAAAGRGISLGELLVGLVDGTVDTLLKNGLRLVELKLGLEVPEVVGVAAAVGAATGIVKVEGLVDNLLEGTTPERGTS